MHLLYCGKTHIIFTLLTIFSLHFHVKNFIGLQWLYNVMLVSTTQQSESAIHIYISPSLPPTHPHPPGYHRALGRAPCAIQQLSTSCFPYGSVYTCHCQSPNSSHHAPRPHICSLCLCLSLCPANTNFLQCDCQINSNHSTEQASSKACTVNVHLSSPLHHPAEREKQRTTTQQRPLLALSGVTCGDNHPLSLSGF